MGAVLLGLLIFFIYISMQVSGPKMKMLYKDLPQKIPASISAKLEETKIPYEVSSDGTTIKVSDKDIGRAGFNLAKPVWPMAARWVMNYLTSNPAWDDQFCSKHQSGSRS